MTNLGRTGLVTSGVIGGVGLQQGVKAATNLVKAGKEANILAEELKNNPELAKKLIKDANKGGFKLIINPIASKLGINPEVAETIVKQPIEKATEQGVEVAKRGWKFWKGLKKSPINRATLGWNYWNKVADAPRLVLLNAGDLSKEGVESIIKDSKTPLTEVEKTTARRIPRIIEKVSRSGLALKNSRGLLKGAAILGGASGLTYVNGRSLQNPNTNNGILTT